LNEFRPGIASAENTGGDRLIGIGRIGPEKNILNLIAAMAVLQGDTGDCPQISWAGARDESDHGQRYCRQIDEALEALPEVRRHWHWLGVQTDIPGLLRRHHALIHPSLYEGLPNAVCEALACGIPVLASDVCDHPLLVTDGERGFLFDPESPRSIATAVTKFTKMSMDERRRLSRNAREYAEANLGVDRMVSAYEVLLAGLSIDTDQTSVMSSRKR
jgi:glycosyltransferase involved in cell wall biosynthesis